MPFRGEWESLSQYTREQLAKYAGKIKVCPKCKEPKEIVGGFGLRNTKASTNKKRYLYPRPHCRACDQVASNGRRKPYSKDPKKRQRDVAYRAAHRKKYNARSKAVYHYPKRQPCSVLGCPNLGERHHHNGYDHPLDIVWLCKAHHFNEHSPLKVAI